MMCLRGLSIYFWKQVNQLKSQQVNKSMSWLVEWSDDSICQKLKPLDWLTSWLVNWFNRKIVWLPALLITVSLSPSTPTSTIIQGKCYRFNEDLFSGAFHESRQSVAYHYEGREFRCVWKRLCRFQTQHLFFVLKHVPTKMEYTRSVVSIWKEDKRKG